MNHFFDTRARVLVKLGVLAAALIVLAATLPLAIHAAPDGTLLTGTVKSAAGAKMSGVTVSAKLEGATITTSVFTDEEGAYYFPAMSAGRYEVWAQADGFEMARGAVDLAATKHQDFELKATKDFAQQLSGDQMLASLPEDTPDDRRLKRVFRNSCTSCHQPNYILQNKFDEKGWTAVLEVMKRVNVAGTSARIVRSRSRSIFMRRNLPRIWRGRAAPSPARSKLSKCVRGLRETRRALFSPNTMCRCSLRMMRRNNSRSITAATGRLAHPLLSGGSTGCMTHRRISRAISGSL